MKTFDSIKRHALVSDWETIAEIAGCSAKNVRLVVNQERTDNFNIQQIFSELIESRQLLSKKYRKTKKVKS